MYKLLVRQPEITKGDYNVFGRTVRTRISTLTNARSPQPIHQLVDSFRHVLPKIALIPLDSAQLQLSGFIRRQKASQIPWLSSIL